MSRNFITVRLAEIKDQNQKQESIQNIKTVGDDFMIIIEIHLLY